MMANLAKFVLTHRLRRQANSSLSVPRTRSYSVPQGNGGDQNSETVLRRPHSPFIEDLECSICNEEFSEMLERQPRTLQCGHTFCTDCIRTFFSTPKKKNVEKSTCCPICRTLFATTDINQVTVSYSILNIVLEIRKHRMRKRNSLGQGDLQSIGYCSSHNAPKQFRCLNCSEWLCGSCVVLNHTNLMEKQCQIKTVQEMVNSKKSSHEEDLEKAKNSHEKIIDAISLARDVIETTKNFLRNDVLKLRNKIKSSNKGLKNLEIIENKMLKTLAEVNKEWGSYSSLSEGIEQAKNFEQFETASEKFKVLPINYLQKDFSVQFRSATWTAKLLLECWLKHPATKFYIEDNDDSDTKRLLRVSIRWPSVCIHSGTIEKSPLGAMIVKFSDVLTKKERNFFLEVNFSSDLNVFLKIHIFHSSSFLDSFVCHCLSRRGLSYRKNPFNQFETVEKTGAKIIWIDCFNPQNKDKHSIDITDIVNEEVETSEYDIISDQFQSLTPEELKEEPEDINLSSGSRTNEEHENVIKTIPCSSSSSQELNSSKLEMEQSDMNFKTNKFERENPNILVNSSAIRAQGTILGCLDPRNGEFCTKFGILLNSALVENSNYINVGSVIEGDLDAIERDMQQDKIDKLVVSDCGVLLEIDAM